MVGNAIQYGEGQPITVTVDDAGTSARLVVRDRGIGFEPSQIERLLQAYERSAADVRASGVGLGLYVSMGIVEAMGGTFTVDSRPGAGSTFTIEVPKRHAGR